MNRLSIDEYKQVELNILIKIDQICRENNIKYYLYAGTLLGAVRHGGFIPWDDDIDISMLRKDYNKLAKIIQSRDFGISFIRIEDNPDTIYPYGKICDKTTLVEEINFKQVEGYGVFVDVFPMDYLPEDEKKRNRLKKKSYKMLRLITHTARTGYVKTDSTITNMKRFGAFYFAKFFNTNRLIRKFNHNLTKLSTNKSNLVGVAWLDAFPVEEFTHTSEIQFEGYTFTAPRNPKRVLTILYGDYMELPPANEQICKHTLNCYRK